MNAMARSGLACAMAVGLLACGKTENSSEPTPDPPAATCGGTGCTTDLARARDALSAGDYARALELYQCAETAEAAFGAGLSRTVLVLSGENAGALLGDFGQPPLAAADVFGATGILSRAAARWEGQGSLTLSGALALELSFDRGQQRMPLDPSLGGYSIFSMQDLSSAAGAELSLEFAPEADGGPLVASGSVLGVSFDCAATFPARTVHPALSWVSLTFDAAGMPHYCQLPYFSSAAGCQPDGGSVLVAAAPHAPDQPASYTLQNLLLACSTDGATEQLIRVSGTVSAQSVGERVDTSGLHPMFGADFSLAAQISAERRVTDVIEHAGLAISELEEAACYFARAGAGSGTVFTIPGVLFGGQDLPVSHADARTLAGLWLLGAGLAQLTMAHGFDMPLNRVVCEGDACPTGREFTDEVNRTFASAFHPEHFRVAQRLVGEGLAQLDGGISSLDQSSLFVKNSISTAGLTMLLDLVRAGRQSLESGNIGLPHVAPQVHFDLRNFFGKPKNPRSIGVPPLSHEEVCDVDYCTSTTELAPTFLDAYFEGSTDVVWEGSDYEWSDDAAVSDAIEEIVRNLNRHFVFDN
jgi:hypothetical protein